MSSKICKKCQTTKDETLFVKGKNYCKECNKIMCKEYKLNNKEKISEYNKSYKNEHKEEIAAYNSDYHQEHKERVYERHAVNVKKYKEKQKDNEHFRKMENIRRSMRIIVRGGKSQKGYDKYLGCSSEFLWKWILFNDPTCKLEDYGIGGWCLDHVVPCMKVDISSDEELHNVFHWSNTQPLSISKNSKKHKYLKREDLDKHMEKLNKFLEENKELILKENIKIPNFDRYQYIDQ